MDIRKIKQILGFDPDVPLPFEDMKYTPAPLLSMKEDKRDKEYTLIPCPCSCHRNPNMKHIVACCDGGFIKVPHPTPEYQELYDRCEKLDKTLSSHELAIVTAARPELVEKFIEHFQNIEKKGNKAHPVEVPTEEYLNRIGYFTPSIEDIRVGYELEYYTKRFFSTGEVKETWTPVVVRTPTVPLYIGEVMKKTARVPYLTKEQIEAEGWELTAAHDNKTLQYNYRKGDVDLYFRPDRRQVFLNRLDYSRTGRHDTDFTLVLKDISINELRYICKLLGI